MDYISIASLAVGAGAGFWFARRPPLSGKLALAFSLTPYAAVAMSYFF